MTNGIVSKEILPYYKIERNDKGHNFFNTHIGYFNFWDEYFIQKVRNKQEVYPVLVNRPGRRFHGKWNDMTEEDKLMSKSYFNTSVEQKKPKEMFEDFPELLELEIY